MTSTADIAERYFTALAAHDLDGAIACWQPGAVDRFVGAQALIAPDGVRRYFADLFAAFPDFSFEILDLTTQQSHSAVRWRARGTFAGPGSFMGFAPNGASIDLEGCDVVTVTDELITHNDAYLDSGDLARQLGLLPPAGSASDARLTRLDADVEQARASIRKLAAMEPSAAWAGHADPVTGDVRAQLERAAAATL